MNQNLHVNKTNFHIKGFALGLALKQRRKATRKSPIQLYTAKGVNKLILNAKSFYVGGYLAMLVS